MLIPGLGGAKLFGKIAEKATKMPFVSGALAALGFELGAASGVESDSGTLLIGNNAMLPIKDGLDVNSDDPWANQELAKRTNILLDGLLAAKLAEGAIKGVDIVGRTAYNMFVKPLFGGTVNAMEQQYVRDLLDAIVDVGDDPKAIEEARLRVAELVEKNKDIYVDMPPELADDVQFSLDTMSALEKAFKNNDSKQAKNIIMTAQARKKGALQSSEGDNYLNIAVGQPAEKVDEVLTQAESKLGGSDAIDQTRLALQKQGTDEIDEAALNVTKATENVANVNANIVKELAEDPSVIGKVTDLESRMGFDIGSVRENSADQIVENLSKASEAMDKTKNDLFAAITGGGVDFPNLIDVLKGLKPDQLDAAAAAMPGDSQFGTLLEQIKLRTKMVNDKPVKETPEEMQERFIAWAGELNPPLDFARLFTDIRPGIVDSINSLELGGAAEKGAAKTLIKFKKWIDEDAIKYLEETGDDETISAAAEAMRYFKEDWAPFWDDGSTLQQIGSLRRETTARGKQGPRFTDEARQLVKNTINDDNRDVAANMVELLKREDSGQSASDVTNYIIGDVLSTLSSRLDTVENVSDLGLEAVRQSLSRYSTLIRNSFGEEAERLDVLVNKLGDNKLTKEALQKELVVAERLAKEAEERIYKVELNGFFKANGVPNPNGYDTLAKIFNNQQSADQITGLMDRAKGNPIIEKGIQAAYSRWLRNNVLGSTTSTAGERTLKMGVDTANREGVKNALDYGDIVFRDKPEFTAALDTILKEAGMVERSRASKAIPTGSGTAELTNQIAAANRGITMVFGVLSRMGAKIRATTVGFMNENFNKQAHFNMVDNLLANPDEFIRVIKDVVRSDKASGTIPIRLPFTKGKELPDFLGGGEAVYYLDRGSLYKMLVRAGVYREGNQDDERSFMEQLADMELELSRGVEEQTEEMLNP